MASLISEYVDWMRACGRSRRTIDDRIEILSRVDADLPMGLDQADTEELKAWIFRDGWSAGTKETYYGAIRSFFVWACNPRNPRLDFDPSDPELLPRPPATHRLPRPVSNDQMGRILAESIEPYRTYSLLAAYEGLRCIEIAGLRREHVTEQALFVERGKGGRPSILPTHPNVWEALQDLPKGPVAWTARGLPANERYVSIRTVLYFRRKLGMEGVGLHRLRHWFGTEVYRATRDIRRTQELLRHSSPATTAGYTLVSDEERKSAIWALPTFERP